MYERIEELRQKYGAGRYHPDPECKNCGGTGEKVSPVSGDLLGCICIYIEDRQMRRIAVESIKTVLKRDKEKIVSGAVNLHSFLTQNRKGKS